MYCPHCHCEHSDNYKYCPICGTKLEPLSNNEKPGTGAVLAKIFVYSVIAIFAIFGFGFALLAFFDISEDNSPDPAQEVSTPALIESSNADAVVPEDGWYTEDGNRYYFSSGAMYVDLHEIDGDYYYFYEDGTLAISTNVDYEICTFIANREGKIDRMILNEIGGEWSEESYRFGNSGRSSILELNIPIEDCSSMTFYLEANGKHGAKVNGKWKIYIRSYGKWEFLQEINYTEPQGSFDVTFDEAKSFDAITAYPTVQGNASYSSFFYLQNVDCSFSVLKDYLE